MGLFLAQLAICSCYASGCFSTFLEGTRPGYGRVPLFSSGMLLTSSLLLKTESQKNDESKKQSGLGLAVSGIYFYFAAHGYCRTVDKKEYLKLIRERERLISSGVELKDLPPKLRWLNPIGGREDLLREIERWKRYQKYLLFIVGGINSLLLVQNAQHAETDGVKIFSYLSVASILGMAVLDVDNLWNDDPPFWANFNVVAQNMNSKIVPSLTYVYRF